MRTQLCVVACVVAACLSLGSIRLAAQQPPKSAPADYSKEPYVVEQVHTSVQYENDGTYTIDSSLRIRVQSASGVQSWGLLQLPYASSVADAEIVDVQVTAPDGTVVATPPENTQDMPAQITVAAPLYSDLKVKQLAVKGLSVGGVLTFRQHAQVRSPLIRGQFWYSDNFTTDAVVLDETLEIKIPQGRAVKVKSPSYPHTTGSANGYQVLTWKTSNLQTSEEREKKAKESGVPEKQFPDVHLSSFQSWDEIGAWYGQLQESRVAPTPEIRAKADELTKGLTTDDAKIRALYSYVATKFRYIGIDFGIGRYQPHAAADVMANGYGDCKDKHTLLAALLAAEGIQAYPALVNSGAKVDPDVPDPGQFNHVITAVPRQGDLLWLDTTPEVAPFGMLLANIRDSQALLIGSGPAQLVKTPANPPFALSTSFQIEGKIGGDGVLDGKVTVKSRSDLEVLFRSAFRGIPQAQWTTLMQNVSQTWSFAGTVSDVAPSAPEAMDDPFSMTYAYTRKDYPSWPDAMRAPLPSFDLDQLADDADKGTEPLKLESPIEYIMDAKIALPKDVTAKARPPVDVKKDFAEYHATYSTDAATNIAHTERRLKILMREIPRSRVAEYREFWKAVSDDENSLIVLSSAGAAAAPVSPSANAGANSPDTRAESLAQLGDSLFAQDPESAIEKYRESLKLAPDNARVHMELGMALANTNDFDGGIAEESEAVRLKPDYADAHEQLGETLGRKGDFVRSLAELQQALRLNPKDVAAQETVARVYVSQRRWEDAVSACRDLVRMEPDEPHAHYELGEALVNAAHMDDAAAEFRLELKMKPDSGEAHAGLGEILFRQNHADQAIDELEQGIKADPNNSQSYALLGFAYRAQHQDDKAVAAWKRYEQLVPANPQGPTNIANLLIQDKRYAEAVAELQPAVARSPKSDDLALLLGQAQLLAGKTDDGVATLKGVAQADSSPSIFNSVGFYLADHNVDLEDAVGYAQRAVEQQEQSTFGIGLAGLAVQDLKNIQNLAAFWDTLGWVYFHQGKLEDAEKYLLAAWQLDQTPAGGDHLGQLYEKLDKKEQAIDYYTMALGLPGPKSEETQNRLAAFIANKVTADLAIRAGSDKATGLRTIAMPKLAQGEARAEFFVLLHGDSVEDARFISGSEALRGAVSDVKTAHYIQTLPDDRATKIVRRGILDCSPSSKNCLFILLLVESTTSVN